MYLNLQGCTRLVFVFRSFVVKVPNPIYSWHNFLQGLLANLTENKTWKYNGIDDEQRILRDQLLCPVLWASWGGWLLIMRRADVQAHIDDIRRTVVDTIEDSWDWNARYYKRWTDAGFGGDDKPDGYGLLDGRLVKVDYGQMWGRLPTKISADVVCGSAFYGSGLSMPGRRES